MNEYAIAGVVSICIFVGCIAAYVLAWVGQWAWAWIDDSEVGEHNALVKVVMTKVFGFEWRQNPAYTHLKELKWVKGSKSVHDVDAFVYVSGFVIFLSLVPLIFVVALNFIYATACAFTVLVVAHLARFARRHKKLFDKRLNDKGAHK